ncbi:MAG: hypothetical protein ACD_74C00273G0008, partial [uncultured bacterium]
VNPFPADPTQVSIDGTSNIKNTTTPPTPQKEEHSEGGGEIDLYLQLVVLPVVASKNDPIGYYRHVKARIEKNGMGERERGQLAAALLSHQEAKNDEAKRTKQLLDSNFSDDHIPPSPDVIRLWQEWDKQN